MTCAFVCIVLALFLVEMLDAATQNDTDVAAISRNDTVNDTMMSGLVHGGHDAGCKAGWTVSLSRNEGSQFFCGGTIIDKRWIVTAAHCLRKSHLFKDVLITTSDLKQKNLSKRRIKYPGFVYPSVHDIALIELSEDIKFDGKYARKMSLPKDHVKGGVSCIVSGWGRMNAAGDKPEEDELQMGKVQTYSQDQLVAYNLVNPGYPYMYIGASGPDGNVGACKGDSGGPLVCPNNAGDLELQGVVSYAIASCGKKKLRGNVLPDFYIRVSKYLPWIKATLAGGSDSSAYGDSLISGSILRGLPHFLVLFPLASFWSSLY